MAMRCRWSVVDDDVLKKTVENVGTNRWSIIALNTRGRTAKQCRDRWVNYLEPSIRHNPLTKREINMIFNMQKEIGNQWVKIAREIPGRSPNQIKGFWYSQHRRKGKRSYSIEKPRNMKKFLALVDVAEEEFYKLGNLQ